MTRLFDGIYDIVFTLADGSQILCAVTLDNRILAKRGWDSFDGFIDLITEREIPLDLFSYEFHIYNHNEYKLSKLDEIFSSGGKVAWKKLV